MFGKLLSTPFRLLNIPAKVIEDIVGTDDDPIISAPLDAIADAVEDALDE